MSSPLPPGWAEHRFGNLCERIVNGGTPSTDIPTYWGGTTPWVTGADFTSQGIGEIRRYVTDLGIHSSSTSVVKAGNLLVVTRTGVGKLAVAPFDIAISQDVTGVYLDRTRADVGFAYHLLSHELEELKKLNQGTSINGIVRSDLEGHLVRIPGSLPEQQRIAAILTSLDTAVEATEALIEKHQQIKAGLMHNLLTRGVAEEGSLRRSALEAPDLYVPTKIGPVPVGWEVTGLQAKQRGADKWIRTGPFGSSLKGKHWVVEGCPVVTIGSLGEGVFDEHELLFVGERDAARLAEFRLKLGDVVFSRVADVGRSVVVRQENVGWIMSSNLMRIAVDASQIRPNFLQMLLAGDARVKAQIRAKVNSGGREVANSEILGQLLFAWPPVDEQDRIIERLQSIEAPIRLDQDRLRKLRMQKQGLMQDLLTGKVRVSVQADASV